MDNNLKKWKTVLDAMNTRTPHQFLADYAEHKLTLIAHTKVVEGLKPVLSYQAALVIGLRVLSKVNFKTLTPKVTVLPVFKDKQAVEVQSKTLNVTVPNTDGLWQSGINVEHIFTNKIADEMIEQLQFDIDIASSNGCTKFYVYDIPGHVTLIPGHPEVWQVTYRTAAM